MTTQISVRGQQSRAPKGSKGGCVKNTCLVRRLRAGMPKIKVWEVTHHLGLGVDVVLRTTPPPCRIWQSARRRSKLGCQVQPPSRAEPPTEWQAFLDWQGRTPDFRRGGHFSDRVGRQIFAAADIFRTGLDTRFSRLWTLCGQKIFGRTDENHFCHGPVVCLCGDRERVWKHASGGGSKGEAP